ncbi:MAG: ATP-binding protein [Balneolaceae bacterium]
MTKTSEYKLVVNALTANLAKVRQFVAEHAFDYGFNDKQVSDIRLAVDEACTNIIKHAYDYDERQQVEIRMGFKKDRLWVTLRDSGITFERKIYRSPDLRDHIKKRKKGGVGVFLIEQHMDEVEYLIEKGDNIIRMVKYRN